MAMRCNLLWSRLFLILLLTLLVSACGNNAPPKGLAPGQEIITHAIARQLTLTEDRLTTQLDNPTTTEFKVKNLDIKSLTPLYVAELPTYKVNGTYSLKLNLPQQEIKQEKNPFEVYLQRQAEGKTWRLLIPKNREEVEEEKQVTTWKSYLVT